MCIISLQVLQKENFNIKNPSLSIGSLWTLSSVWFATISLWKTHQTSFLHSILFDLHIFLYAYRVFPFMSTCIKHLFGFLPRHKHMNFKSKWIVHLYIHNKIYKLRALFLPQGFFLSTNQVLAPHFSFHLEHFVHNQRSFFINKSTQANKEIIQLSLRQMPSQGRSGLGRGEWSVRIRRALKVYIRHEDD